MQGHILTSDTAFTPEREHYAGSSHPLFLSSLSPYGKQTALLPIMGVQNFLKCFHPLDLRLNFVSHVATCHLTIWPVQRLCVKTTLGSPAEILLCHDL